MLSLVLGFALALAGPQWGSLEDERPEIQWGSPDSSQPSAALAVIQRPAEEEKAPAWGSPESPTDGAEPRDEPSSDPDTAEPAAADREQAAGGPEPGAPSSLQRPSDPPAATSPDADSEATPPAELPPKPRRGKMEQHPYGQTDFTAYTLEWGEMRIRPATVSTGVLPRVQVGTAPALWAMQIRNLHAKWNLLRLGPVDLAASGTAGWVPSREGLTDEGFEASYRVLGGHASLQIAGGWSLHATTRYHQASFAGAPDPAPAIRIASKLLQVEVEEGMYDLLDEFSGYDAPQGTAEAVTTEVALDFRFNRRDSFQFRFRWTPWVSAQGDFGDIPPPEGVDQQVKYEGNLPVAASYVATFSYQLSWRHWGLRLGVGQSAVPYLWVVPAFGLSYRWGGETRSGETRSVRDWRQHKRALKKSRR